MDIHFLLSMLQFWLITRIKNPKALAQAKPYFLDFFNAMKLAFAGDPDFQSQLAAFSKQFDAKTAKKRK